MLRWPLRCLLRRPRSSCLQRKWPNSSVLRRSRRQRSAAPPWRRNDNSLGRDKRLIQMMVTTSCRGQRQTQSSAAGLASDPFGTASHWYRRLPHQRENRFHQPRPQVLMHLHLGQRRLRREHTLASCKRLRQAGVPYPSTWFGLRAALRPLIFGTTASSMLHATFLLPSLSKRTPRHRQCDRDHLWSPRLQRRHCHRHPSQCPPPHSSIRSSGRCSSPRARGRPDLALRAELAHRSNRVTQELSARLTRVPSGQMLYGLAVRRHATTQGGLHASGQ
jgi:hypothetical protein